MKQADIITLVNSTVADAIKGAIPELLAALKPGMSGVPAAALAAAPQTVKSAAELAVERAEKALAEAKAAAAGEKGAAKVADEAQKKLTGNPMPDCYVDAEGYIVLRIDPNADHGVSSTGKTRIVAKTAFPGQAPLTVKGVTIQLNAWRKA